MQPNFNQTPNNTGKTDESRRGFLGSAAKYATAAAVGGVATKILDSVISAPSIEEVSKLTEISVEDLQFMKEAYSRLKSAREAHDQDQVMARIASDEEGASKYFAEKAVLTGASEAHYQNLYEKYIKSFSTLQTNGDFKAANALKSFVEAA